MRRSFRALSVAYRRSLLLIMLGLVVVREMPPSDDLNFEVTVRVGDRQFDFIGWTLNALGLKLLQSASTEQSYLGTSERKQLVLDYFALSDQSLNLDQQIERIFADPDESSPEAASLALKAELAGLRARMGELAPLVEAVLQEQIASVLAGEGFGVGGQIVPPISFHITALPGFLVISPRERIELTAYANLEPGLTAADESSLEDRMEQELNVSALIVPLGGMGTYPTMIYETSNLNYALEVGAHEWAHNYLTLRPLGISYESSPDLRTMNETAATLVGREIGQAVVARYYPERLPPAPAPTPAPGPDVTPAPTPPPDPNAFDFNTEMHKTRVRVDVLLAAGEVGQAEAYMETRRRIFVEHGHQIRKLNQAYFAFYGAYSAGPGAGGQDPVGPAVRALRQRSSTLKAFLDAMSWMTSFEELQEAIKQ